MPAGRNKSGFTIKKLILGEMAANCYLLTEDTAKETIIVDPGDEADYIETVIADLGLNPTSVIATHGHSDHIGAVLELKLAYNIPFLVNKKDSFLLKRSSETSKHFTKVATLKLPPLDKNLKDGVKIPIGKFFLKVIEIPGHTPGSIGLVGENLVFLGDLLFADGSIGRCDFSYSDPQELKKSVKKILKLSKNTIIYPGHGPEFILGEIRT